MPLEPRESDIPRIPGALRFYQVMAIITGTFLMLLVVEMIVAYAFGYHLILNDPNGFLYLAPGRVTGFMQFELLTPTTGIDLSKYILIVHGWLYVIYLISSFRLWSFMRWSFPKLIVLALGGIIPVLSFILEAVFTKQVRAYLTAK
jgi:integral membrane protein